MARGIAHRMGTGTSLRRCIIRRIGKDAINLAVGMRHREITHVTQDRADALCHAVLRGVLRDQAVMGGIFRLHVHGEDARKRFSFL